jgi:hypothetical protein
MTLNKMDVSQKTFQSLAGAEVVYTIHQPFSSRFDRTSIYRGVVERVEGNNVMIKNEKDLIRGNTKGSYMYSFIEFEELFTIK